MKVRYLLLAGVFIGCCQACSTEVDFGEQYKKQIYIVNANNRYVENTLPFGDSAEGFVTFYCSGTELSDKDIQVKYQVDQEALDRFNQTEYDNNPALSLIGVSEELISFREPEVTIKAGEEYGTLYFTIHTADLDPALNYAVPVTITGVSDYEINEEVKTLFYKIKFKTAYSGVYNSTADVYKGSFGDYDATKYIQKTVLPASKNSVKVPIFDKKEVVPGSKDYYVITLDEETNTVTLSSEAEDFENVEAFSIWDKGFVNLDINYYNPETKEFVVGYKYKSASDPDRKVYEVIKLIE